MKDHTDKLQKDNQKAQELHLSFDMFLKVYSREPYFTHDSCMYQTTTAELTETRPSLSEKEEDAAKTVEKAERTSKEVLQMEEQIEKIVEEQTELMERKHELDRLVQRRTVYRDIMEQMVKMTKVGSCEDFHLAEKTCDPFAKRCLCIC